MTDTKDFTITAKGILKKYKGSCGNVIIPSGVTSISEDAFDQNEIVKHVQIPNGVKKICFHAFQNCVNLESVCIPESVTEIGSFAFANCVKLQKIVIPENVNSIEEWTFFGCTGLEVVVLPENLTDISIHAFAGCSNIKKWVCGKSLSITPQAFQSANRSIELPPFFVTQFLDLLPNISDSMLRELITQKDVWNIMNAQQQVELYLKRQSKTILPAYAKAVNNPDAMCSEMVQRMDQTLSSTEYNYIVGFCEIFAERINKDLIKQVHEKLMGNPSAKRALKKFQDNGTLMANTLSQTEKITKAEEMVRDAGRIEKISQTLLGQNVSEFYKISDIPKIYDTNGNQLSECVLQWLLITHECKPIAGKDTVQANYKKPGVKQCVSDVITLLDERKFQNALRTLAEQNLGVMGHDKRMYLAYPICRYADEALMEKLTKEAPKWRSSVSGNDAPPLKTFRQACLYSNTKAAMLFVDKFNDLDAYAEIRGTDADTIRDLYLSDAGIDGQGEKNYDLGNQTVTAVLQPDLTFLIHKADGKTAKSLPKKDADPEKYDAANADFSEMKKNAKKIVKNRSAVLLEDFISGRSRKADGWKKAYLQNPLLRSVAKLLVWQQGNSTFTLNETGAIQVDGSSYEISGEEIAVAHPMEMKPAQVEAWQKYFTTHALKQPFAQIWEPVADPSLIKKDRYQGCMIPYYKFRSMEKHGITVEDWDFHNEIEISFAECQANVERIDLQRHEIDNNDRFEVKDFSFREYTRQVNHIVAYLDRITVYDHVLKDDVSIADQLSSFTLAQITDFIKLATENSCPNVTALLLNYKNEHFADFDPMEEFTLEEL